MLLPLANAFGIVMGETPPDRLSVVREAPIGAIIPDLLIGRWPEGRQFAPRNRSTLPESYVLAVVEAGVGISRHEIARRLYISIEDVSRLVARLKRRGAIQELEADCVTLAPAYATRDLELIAIEAKLSRWRDALDQAIEYRAFANWSYVVIDGNRIQTTRAMINAFADSGVGLIFQYGFALSVAVTAPFNSPISPTRVRAADTLFGHEPAPRAIARIAALSEARAVPPGLVD